MKYIIYDSLNIERENVFECNMYTITSNSRLVQVVRKLLYYIFPEEIVKNTISEEMIYVTPSNERKKYTIDITNCNYNCRKI